MNNSPVQRPVILAGNWKMNLVRAEAAAFARTLASHFGSHAADNSNGADRGGSGDTPNSLTVMLFPSTPYLVPMADLLRGSGVMLGAQDLHSEEQGAHTGDVAGRQLRSAGASWVLCGHSERRHNHGESNELVAVKTQAALTADLRPMVCVGETLEQRDAGKTESVLEEQVRAVLDGCPNLDRPGLEWALAYEPVWAIGTGKTATPEIAQTAHSFLRNLLVDALGDHANRLPLLYGGSAKPANCQSLLHESDVDGLLVGGASLDSQSFLDMIRRCGERAPSVS